MLFRSATETVECCKCWHFELSLKRESLTSTRLVLAKCSSYVHLYCNVQGGPKMALFVRLNFTEYQPIFKIISLSESGENL